MPPKVRAQFAANATHQDTLGGVNANRSNQALFEGALGNGALRLANRGLTELPSQMFELGEVQYANKKWWEETDLTILDVSHNSIRSLDFPPGFQRQQQNSQGRPETNVFSSLRSFMAGHNQIQNFPERVLSFLGNVTKLDLSHNAITELPFNTMGKALPLIVELDISHNKLQAFGGFSRCSHLSVLRLAGNQITQFEGQVYGGGYPQLGQLDLSGNQLEFLEGGNTGSGGVFASPALREVDLSKNRLSTLQGLVGPGVTTFSCRNNRVSTIDRFTLQDATGLKDLQLGCNRISEIPLDTFTVANQIAVLDLSSNAIPDVGAVVQLRQLRRLDLQNNCLSTLPAKLCYLRNLTGLVLDGNPLRGLRREIVAKGTVEILNYLKTRLTEEELAELESLGRNGGFQGNSGGAVGRGGVGITEITTLDSQQTMHQPRQQQQQQQNFGRPQQGFNTQQPQQSQQQLQEQYHQQQQQQSIQQHGYDQGRGGGGHQQSGNRATPTVGGGGGAGGGGGGGFRYQDQHEVEETQRVSRGRGARTNANSVNLFGAPEEDPDAFKSEVGGVKLAHAGSRSGALWDLSRQVTAKVPSNRITMTQKSKGGNAGAPELPQEISGNLNFSELHNYEEAVAIRTVKFDGQSAVQTIRSDFLARLPQLVEVSLDHTAMGSNPQGFLIDRQTPESLARLSFNRCSFQGPLLPLVSPELRSCHITRLSLVGNGISDLPWNGVIGPLSPTLQYLDMSENRLTVFPEALYNCPELIELQLGRNTLGEFDLSRAGGNGGNGPSPDDLWPKMNLLDISFNNLTTIPLTLCHMESHLRSLKVEGNPMKWLRRAVVDKGTIAILEYLKSRIPTG